MKTKIIEATNGPQNWGKFMICRYDAAERAYPSVVDPGGPPLLRKIGWSPDFIWVLDMQTGEGAYFRHGGLARADLNRQQIWVCPLYEPFLAWLYEQDISDLDALPAHVDIPDAGFSFQGYRRPGPLGDLAPSFFRIMERAAAIPPLDRPDGLSDDEFVDAMVKHVVDHSAIRLRFPDATEATAAGEPELPGV